MLHGFGSDGNDLIQLAKVWAQFMPEALFLAPNAPEVCTTSPSGYQWFSLADLSKAELRLFRKKYKKYLNVDDYVRRADFLAWEKKITSFLLEFQ